ncbi:MAG: thioredoxin domain-containing protein [Gemmatimonadaceae bacterium]
MNRLEHETSPYLKQHADNPVDWYPWGDEALARAKREDKPILLSIGYAACHWCHVMAHESFEDEETARLMNEWFVNIKVDREERPDLDAVYMQAVQAMTGHGGWPMTVFLTPDGTPFFGGTYFPPNEKHGLPSFRRILQSIATAYLERPAQIADTATRMRDFYAAQQDVRRATGEVTPRTLELAYRALERAYDERFAGFGSAPKFPPTMALDFLLRYGVRTGQERALEMALSTFRAMARGGMYDQIGGGFHRYSVDERWLVPHFEKMLYDNALLVRFGVHLWQQTHDAEVRRVVEQTISWLTREMTSRDSGFCSSLDADSEGREGAYYVWTLEEQRAVLGEDAELAAAYWGVSAQGNFESHGESVLHVATEPSVVAVRFGLTSEELEQRVDRMRQALASQRTKRERPGLDAKILAAWNGLMLRGVAEAARAFGDHSYRELAIANAEFLERAFVRDGRVSRSHKDGVTKGAGFLEDYAAIALAWLDAYSLTGERRWLDSARSLGDSTVTWFWDAEAGAWYDTARDHERLVTRPRDATDNAMPSGTSLATELMLRLAVLTGNESYRAVADRVLAALGGAMAQHPSAFGHLLGAADFAAYGPVELAVIGPPESQSVAEMLRHVAVRYLPSLVLVHSDADPESDVPLLHGRPADETAVAYVCRHYVCEAPARSVEELSVSLSSALRVAAPSVP